MCRDRELLVEARWEYDNGPFPYIRWTITHLDRDRGLRYRE